MNYRCIIVVTDIDGIKEVTDIPINHTKLEPLLTHLGKYVNEGFDELSALGNPGEYNIRIEIIPSSLPPLLDIDFQMMLFNRFMLL